MSKLLAGACVLVTSSRLICKVTDPSPIRWSSADLNQILWMDIFLQRGPPDESGWDLGGNNSSSRRLQEEALCL